MKYHFKKRSYIGTKANLTSVRSNTVAMEAYDRAPEYNRNGSCTIDRLYRLTVMALLMVLNPLLTDAQVRNYRENATAMRVYEELKTVFPNSFFENIDNFYARYDVTETFVSPSEYQKKRELIEHIRSALDSIKCARKVSDVEDSSDVKKIQYVMVTYDSLKMQKDFILLNVNDRELHYQYRANVQWAGAFAKVGKTIADSYILDRFDSLFYSYSKRKGVKKVAVEYQGEYASSIFQFSDRWLNNRMGGYKYVVPDCSERDFRKFVKMFRLYPRENNIVYINMTNPNSVEEVEVAVVRHDGRAVNIGAKLKGSDLYLIYTLSKEVGENKKNSVLPFGWDEEKEPWSLNGPETPKANEKYVKDGETVYLSVDRLAVFPGDNQSMKAFVDAHLNPSIPSDPHVSGYNMVQFIVGVDGSVHDVRIVKSLNPETDAESIRVVSMMPKWEPAIKNKKKVSSSIIIPITYNNNN